MTATVTVCTHVITHGTELTLCICTHNFPSDSPQQISTGLSYSIRKRVSCMVVYNMSSRALFLTVRRATSFQRTFIRRRSSAFLSRLITCVNNSRVFMLPNL